MDAREHHSRVTEGELEVRAMDTNTDILRKNYREHLTSQFLIFRAEREQLNEKLKEGEKMLEVDDSGFYAGECKEPEFVKHVCCCLNLIPLSLPLSLS